MTHDLDGDAVLYGALLPTGLRIHPEAAGNEGDGEQSLGSVPLSPQMKNIIDVLDQVPGCTTATLHAKVRPTISGPRYLQGENGVEGQLRQAEADGLVRKMHTNPLSQAHTSGPDDTHWVLTEAGLEMAEKHR